MEIKNRIIDGATELFRSYGIKAVTMDSLANHLGISKRTIYEVFSDKEEILIGVLKRMTDKQKELVNKLLNESENSIVVIFKLLEINRDHLMEMSPAFQADLKKIHHDVLIKKAHKCEMPDYRNNIEVIERGIQEKYFREDINPDLVNRCLYSLGKKIMDNELYPYEQFTRKEVIRNIFINYLRGIATLKGLNLIDELEQKF